MVACCLLLSFISRMALSGGGGVEEKAEPLSGCSARLHPIVGEKPAGFPRQLASLLELEPVKKKKKKGLPQNPRKQICGNHFHLVVTKIKYSPQMAMIA